MALEVALPWSSDGGRCHPTASHNDDDDEAYWRSFKGLSPWQRQCQSAKAPSSYFALFLGMHHDVVLRLWPPDRCAPGRGAIWRYPLCSATMSSPAPREPRRLLTALHLVRRIATGMAVCSMLRRELAWAPLVILNGTHASRLYGHCRKQQIADTRVCAVGAVKQEVTPRAWAVMARFLKLFHGRIHVCSSGESIPGSALMKGLTLAVAAGWSGPSLLQITGTDVGDEDCARLAVYLHECPFLHTLSFPANQISSDGVFALSCALRHCRALVSIDLSRNNIGPTGCGRLAAQLKHCTTLQTLHLTDCQIGPLGAERLAAALPGGCRWGLSDSQYEKVVN